MLSHQKSLKILTVSGIPIKLDISWIFIFIFLTWSLAKGYYAEKFSHIPGLYTWAVSVLSALLVFMCILLHELSHSIVAQKTGMKIKEITLFIFGGVAQMTKDPEEPDQEFAIAVAGPFMSFVLAGAFLGMFFSIRYFWGVNLLTEMFFYLVIINGMMIFFNMLPGLPLDGGRVLKAIIWKITGNLLKSAKITSVMGKLFGYFFVFMGIYLTFKGNLGGIWPFAIGLFLVQSAKISYEGIMINHLLKGVKVSDALTPIRITIPSHITLSELSNNYFMKYPNMGYPVVKTIICIESDEKEDLSYELSKEESEDNQEQITSINADIEGEDETRQGEISRSAESETSHKPYKTEIVGFVSLNDLMSVPKKQWNDSTVMDLINAKGNSCLYVPPQALLKDMLQVMTEDGFNCLIVKENDEIQGIVTQNEIMSLISVRNAMQQQLGF